MNGSTASDMICAHIDEMTRREDHAYRGLSLQCPHCRTDLEELICPACGFEVRINHGIACALPLQEAARYSRFIADYERIRAAEGRGCQDGAFYIGLPYIDTTGRNSMQWKIRSRSYDWIVRRIMKPMQAHGLILDLGAGNCWMSFRLALSGFTPVAVDLLTNVEDGLGAATHFRPYLRNPIPRFQAAVTHLPFRGKQFDAIIFNASFHYAEDYEATLREALRCLKYGGMLIISDTPWYSQEESGRKMVEERHATFRERFQTASDSVKSLEFLTDERLRLLEEKLSIRWTVYKPWYGCRWALRPLIAKLRGRREPSRFRIYVARRDA
jgi:SAM-dependent methyltransferase